MTFSKCVFFLAALTLFLNCSGTDQLTVHRESQPPEVDGNLADWNTSESRLKSTSEIDYYATVHGNNLYLFVDVKGLMKHSSVSKSGLIVYLSTSEENRKSTGVAFPPGTYNMLRNYPNAFESFTTDMEWSRKPENIELLNNLSEEMFSSIMIVERPRGSNDPEYGFIDNSQLEIDGYEITANEERRFISIEMKIPLGNTSLFDLTSNNIWLGFSIEPPDFNFREESASVSQNRRDSYGRRSQREANMRYAISRNLGQGDDWFLISIE